MQHLVVEMEIGGSNPPMAANNVNMKYNYVEKDVSMIGYYVDEKGNLYSPTHKKVLTTLSRGYQGIMIKIGAKRKHLSTHRLQAYQKYGDRIYEQGIEVRHLDGNPLNNSRENIAIGTHSENIMDIPESVRKRTATYAASFITVYDKEKVSKIKEFKKTHGYKDTMREFGISSKGSLWNILNKR